MGKRREKSSKEGELANFPEENTVRLTNPRYLALATSLILVFSAFASLLAREEITGQVTSDALSRWKSQGLLGHQGLGGTWRQNDEAIGTNQRASTGQSIVSFGYRCPREAVNPPAQFASTSNANKCFNAAQKANQVLAMCAYEREMNGRVSIAWIKCARL